MSSIHDSINNEFEQFIKDKHVKSFEEINFNKIEFKPDDSKKEWDDIFPKEYEQKCYLREEDVNATTRKVFAFIDDEPIYFLGPVLPILVGPTKSIYSDATILYNCSSSQAVEKGIDLGDIFSKYPKNIFFLDLAFSSNAYAEIPNKLNVPAKNNSKAHIVHYDFKLPEKNILSLQKFLQFIKKIDKHIWYNIFKNYISVKRKKQLIDEYTRNINQINRDKAFRDKSFDKNQEKVEEVLPNYDISDDIFLKNVWDYCEEERPGYDGPYMFSAETNWGAGHSLKVQIIFDNETIFYNNKYEKLDINENNIDHALHPGYLIEPIIKFEGFYGGDSDASPRGVILKLIKTIVSIPQPNMFGILTSNLEESKKEKEIDIEIIPETMYDSLKKGGKKSRKKLRRVSNK
tara:strand:- start:5649 stop:6857 length:1209 start_codon:yes stop_codon:yes gene_type:complete